MTIIRPLITGVILIALSGCAAGFTISGQTSASKRLKQDILDQIHSMVAEEGCKKLKSVETSIVDKSDKYNALRGTGYVEESWRTTYCGKTVDFKVNVKPDGRGGASFWVAYP